MLGTRNELVSVMEQVAMTYAMHLNDERLFLVTAGLGMLRFSPMPADRKREFDHLLLTLTHRLKLQLPDAYAVMVANGELDAVETDIRPSRPRINTA
jgi:hypothetical protein